MQFLDPTNDFAFKKIFGDENKKHILISFLNSVLHLPLNEQITDVTLLKPNQIPHLPGAKETIVDVRCHDQVGADYIVEMQVLHKEFFDRRVLYYASMAYTQQLSRGEGYENLRPVIFLGILNFKFTQHDHYISTHCVQNIETREHVLKDFRFTFVELPKFLKTEPELETTEDQWLYFLKHTPDLEVVPDVIHDVALKEAFEIVHQCNWDRETLMAYYVQGIYKEDRVQEINYGYNRGREKGREEGREEGERVFLLRLLEHRFGVLSSHDLERLDQAHDDKLLLWGQRVLDAKTLQEIFEV